jgi:hypothetical protein
MGWENIVSDLIKLLGVIIVPVLSFFLGRKNAGLQNKKTQYEIDSIRIANRRNLSEMNLKPLLDEMKEEKASLENRVKGLELENEQLKEKLEAIKSRESEKHLKAFRPPLT